MKNKIRLLYIFICIFLVISNVLVAEIYENQIVLNNIRPIRVGILRSHPKNSPVTEKFVVNATLMAIEEINRQYGVLNRKIEPVIINGTAGRSITVEEIEKKIEENKLSVVFCCGNPSICEIISPICEKYNVPMFCPCRSGKFKKSSHVVFTGTLPNQQINPAIKWCSDNFWKKYFLVGSNTTSSKAYNTIIKSAINTLGGEIAGEVFIPEGSGDFENVMRRIVETKPDVILNTISGESNVYFFINLLVKKIKSDKVPVISFSIAEDDYKNISHNEAAGTYIVKSYFQNIDSEENNKFFKEIREKCGELQIIDDSVEAGYFGVFLWKQAVEEAGTDDTKEIMRFLTAQNFNAPEGMVCIDAGNQYTWKTIRIAKVGTNKQFNIVWSSESPVNPLPYPFPFDKSGQR